jgi:hypothetical protein
MAERGQLYTSATFLGERDPITTFVGDWMGLRPPQDRVAKKNFCPYLEWKPHTQPLWFLIVSTVIRTTLFGILNKFSLFIP